MREEIKSAEWLENCAKCMEDEGLDRENNSRHFRAGADAIRYYLAALTDPAQTDAETQEALRIFKNACKPEALNNAAKYGGKFMIGLTYVEAQTIEQALSRPASAIAFPKSRSSGRNGRQG